MLVFFFTDVNKNSVILLTVATVQGIFNDVDYRFWQSCTDLYLLKVINNSSGLNRGNHDRDGVWISDLN